MSEVNEGKRTRKRKKSDFEPIHVRFAFGVRDQKKYADAINLLQQAEDGDLSKLCKDALQFYAKAMAGEPNPAPLPIQPKHEPIPRQEMKKQDEEKQGFEEITPPSSEKKDDDKSAGGIDGFLGGL